MEIDQYKLDNRLQKIVYQREKQFPFYERFVFFSKDNKKLGSIGKVEKNSQNAFGKETVIMVNKSEKKKKNN